MNRRSMLASGLALAATAIPTVSLAQFNLMDLPRESDPLAKAAGAPVFADGPLANNLIARYFGKIPALDLPLDADLLSDTGKLRFSDLTGKIRLLALWAEWCPPCLHELKELSALQQRHGDDHFEVASLLTASSKHLDRADAQACLDAAGVSGVTSLIEPNGQRKVFDAVCGQGMMPGRNSIPCVLLVDASGVIRARNMGLPGLPPPAPAQPATPPPQPREGDVIIDSVTTREMKPGDAFPPSLWLHPDADAFVEALKTGALG